MDYKGRLVCWNRKTTSPYYGVITGTELRECGAPLPPWRWFRIKWTTPVAEEFTEEWFRCDHVNLIDGYAEISKIHKAMTESERVKGAS